MEALIPPTDLWPFSWTCTQQQQLNKVVHVSTDPNNLGTSNTADTELDKDG